MTDEQNEAMKDLGLVVANKEEALWDKVITQIKEIIRQSEESILVNRAILEMAELKKKNAT